VKPKAKGQFLSMMRNTPRVHFVSSVTHVWVPGAKTTGPIVKICFFLKSNFYVSENLKFQCDRFNIKKDVSHPVAAMDFTLQNFFISAKHVTKLEISHCQKN
jgi:hypothetical protein